MENSQYKNFEEIALEWIKRLNNYNEGPFAKKSSDLEWSMGELYQHLYLATTRYHIKNINCCIEKKEGQIGGSKTLKGLFVSLFGSYRGKMNPQINQTHPPAQPENIAVAKDQFYKLLKEMEKLNQVINKLSKDDLKYKTQHHIQGYMNAKEWYSDVEKHFKHHLKQREKIEQTLVVN